MCVQLQKFKKKLPIVLDSCVPQSSLIWGVDKNIIRDRTGHRWNVLFQYEKATNRKQLVQFSSIFGSESKRCITTFNVEKSHGVNKGQVADNVISIFQDATFNNCNCKVVINSNCDNVWFSQLLCYILWRKLIFVVCVSRYLVKINLFMSHY